MHWQCLYPCIVDIHMTSLESIYEFTANWLKLIGFIPVLTVGEKSPSTKTHSGCWLSSGKTYAIRVQELSKQRLMICHVVFSQRVNKWYEIRTAGDLEHFFKDRVLVFLQSLECSVPQLERLARRCDENAKQAELLILQWSERINRNDFEGPELDQAIQFVEGMQKVLKANEILAARFSTLADCRTRRVGY